MEGRDESPSYERPQTWEWASSSSCCTNSHPLSPGRRDGGEPVNTNHTPGHLRPDVQMELEKIYLLTHILGTLCSPSGVTLSCPRHPLRTAEGYREEAEEWDGRPRPCAEEEPRATGAGLMGAEPSCRPRSSAPSLAWPLTSQVAEPAPFPSPSVSVSSSVTCRFQVESPPTHTHPGPL